jgi:ATP-dependent RNA helicase DeaD
MNTLKFDELNLSKELTKAITDLGYEEATPIQSQAIPFLLEGRDLIGQAQTGTGKTAAFGIPIIEKVDTSDKKPQVIVLCPTRELAVQVAEGLNDLIKYKKGIRIIPIYGGQSIDRQIRAVQKGAQIIIATPGRLLDHLERKTIIFDGINTVVLDEADEMLNMGFISDIEKILKRIPKTRQTVLFSATMPKPILELSKKYLTKPEHIKVVHKELTVPNIQQFYYEIKPQTKLEVLTRLIDVHNPKLSLVFCNTKRAVDNLVSHLDTRGYSADALHGDLKQSQRDKVMAKFRSGKLDLLVATDVAARGIDVDDIDAVFNYDMPQDEEYYVHRIGRTARAGRTGMAHTFVVGKELYKMRDIERYTNSKITRKQAPSSEDVAEVKASTFLDDVKAAIGDKTDLKKYEHYIETLSEEDYTTFEIAAGLVKMLMKSESKPVEKKEEMKIHEFDSERPRKRERNNDRRSERSSDRGDRSSDRRDGNRRDDRKDERSSSWGDKKKRIDNERPAEPSRYGKDKFGGKDKFATKDRYGYNKRSDSGDNDRYGKSGNDKYGKKDKFKSDEKRVSKPEPGMVRLYVNVGKKNDVSPGDIVGAFAGEAGIPSSSIGSIDVYDKFTFVDVKSKHVKDVLDAMDGNQIRGKDVSIQEAKGKE